jgi:hypothetical protein
VSRKPSIYSQDLHPEDVLVRLDRPVAHLGRELHLERGLLDGEHDLRDVFRLPGRQRSRLRLGLLLRRIELAERIPEGGGKAAPLGNRLSHGRATDAVDRELDRIDS